MRAGAGLAKGSTAGRQQEIPGAAAVGRGVMKKRLPLLERVLCVLLGDPLM